jgi:hypothetical protein
MAGGIIGAPRLANYRGSRRATVNVRFAPESGFNSDVATCPLWANTDIRRLDRDRK